jgi:hypothetical protein
MAIQMMKMMNLRFHQTGILTWEELLLQEEKAEQDNETDSNSDYDEEVDEILLNSTHSALDNEAK